MSGRPALGSMYLHLELHPCLKICVLCLKICVLALGSMTLHCYPCTFIRICVPALGFVTVCLGCYDCVGSWNNVLDNVIRTPHHHHMCLLEHLRRGNTISWMCEFFIVSFCSSGGTLHVLSCMQM
jgi:hypothetical protein